MRATVMMRARPVLCAVALSAIFAGCGVDPYCLDCVEGDASVDQGRDGMVLPGDMDVADQRMDRGVCVPTGEDETCNEQDDDCDTRVDEGFDLQTDALHCGDCDTSCLRPNANVACEEGECTQDGCFDGFADIDTSSAAPGCEYRCPVFPTTSEDCNGIDDDCDGRVDEAVDLPPPPAGLCRTTPGTPCEGTVPVCETRNGIGTWYCDYAPEVEFDPDIPSGVVLQEQRCDGFDGDCDGVADDAFPTLGTDCDNGDLGACRDEGRVVCDPTDTSATMCDFTQGPNPVPGAPMAEACNGIDDNCDGVIDNSDPMDPDRVIDDMVHITHGGMDFYIYRYEASRPDASDADAGAASQRACSNANVLPWTTVAHSAAAAACSAAGFRLCTGPEWQAACEAATATTYPYGNAYAPMTCNGGDRDAIPGGMVNHSVAPTGALAACVSGDGVLDMSGNVKEWTEDPRTGPPATFVIRGGSFESPELGLTCQTTLSQALPDTAQATLGFRCCSDVAP
ncbi:MAG: SUMF1/EgtB/PvdO family nonheme iron enzyme [Polyangiales bacterium]